MTRILLTGGAGFIGSVVLKALNDKGLDHVYLVDDLGSDERWKNLVGKRFVDFIPKEQCFAFLEGNPRLDAIIHLGACSSTVEKNAQYLLENNTLFSKQLASYAFDHKLRFIYASSAATYGDGSHGFSDDHALLETYHPLNMYGFSKHLFDLWLKQLGWLTWCVGLKYFNVFGPNEFHKGRMASAVIKMVADLKKEGKISLFKSSEPEKFADGEQVRDFIYVKDVAEMTVQFLDNSYAGIYNIGSGKAETWNALAEGVIAGMQGKGVISYVPMPEDLLGKYQNYTCADMQKSYAAHLYLPRYSLKDAVMEYVKEYVLPGKCY